MDLADRYRMTSTVGAESIKAFRDQISAGAGVHEVRKRRANSVSLQCGGRKLLSPQEVCPPASSWGVKRRGELHDHMTEIRVIREKLGLLAAGRRACGEGGSHCGCSGVELIMKLAGTQPEQWLACVLKAERDRPRSVMDL